MNIPPTLFAARKTAVPIIAIDPGLSGAFARLDTEGQLTLVRDFAVKFDMALGMESLYQTGDIVVCELVHAMPGQGVCSMFSFGESFGYAQAAAEMLSHRQVITVTPQKWQNFYRATLAISREEAFDSRSLAIALFPEARFNKTPRQRMTYAFERKLDHNSADAALIALWYASTH